MIIYADILFLINAIITYILLLCTALIFKSGIKRLRILFSALIGGAYSLIILVDINAVLGLFLKIAVCSLIIIVAFGFKSVGWFLKYTCVFLVMNFLLAGVVLGLSFVSNKNFYSNIYVSYINVSPILLILTSAVAYIIISIISRYALTHINKNKIYRVTLSVQSSEYKICGCLDTGNSLLEPFSGYPVVIVKKGIIKNFSQLESKRIIPFSSVGGDGILYAVKAEIEITDGKKILKSDRVYVAQSEQALKRSQYDIILHPEVFCG